jgi:hypothetical protein
VGVTEVEATLETTGRGPMIETFDRDVNFVQVGYNAVFLLLWRMITRCGSHRTTRYIGFLGFGY